MKTVGIVAEYNPIHSGHIHQLSTLRAEGYTHIAVAMSGNFVQRGECAAFTKFARAELAIKSGADLVIEIPTPYAMSTAERFAMGSVWLLKNVGVGYLSFGSECGNIALLKDCARAVDDACVNERLREYLSDGTTFVRARQRAISDVYSDKIANVLSSPNNTLGIEYMRAIARLGAGIEPTTIQRRGADHDTDELLEHISASAVRKAFNSGKDDILKEYLPEYIYTKLKAEQKEGRIYSPKALDRVILSRLRLMEREDFLRLADVSEGLENRIMSAIRSSNSFDELLFNTKSKRYTLARLRRIYMCAFLGITADFYDNLPPYARILAMNERGKDLLAVAKKTSEIPINSSLKKLSESSEIANKFAKKELECSNIYSTLTERVMPYGFDLLQKLIVYNEHR